MLYLLQLKEYRFDRLKEFVLSSEWKKFFFNKTLVAYYIIFFVYIINYKFFSNNFFDLISWFFIAILVLNNLYILYKIKIWQFLYPKITNRSIIIFIISWFVQTFVYFISFFHKHFFLWLFFLLFFTYDIVFFVNLILSPFINYKKKKIMKLAEEKIIKFSDLKKIWITWSFWKSSTKKLLHQLLSQKKTIITTPKNINTEMWVSEFILNNVDKKYEYFISEMGAYKIWEIEILSNIVNPKYWFITWIWEQHIWLFGSKDNIRKAKFELATKLEQNKWTLYLNIDSLKNLSFLKKYKCKIIKYSLFEKNADAFSKITSTTINWTKFIFTYWKITKKFHTNIFWKHNILNLTGVLAFLIDQGIDISKLNLNNLKLPDNTLQLKKIDSDFIYIDDTYNLSVWWLMSGLEFLHYFEEFKPKILVLDDILELWNKSKHIHIEIWKKISTYDFDKIFLVWKNFTKYIEIWLQQWGFNMDNVFYNVDLIKTIKKWIVLLEWRNAKIF